MPIRLSREKVDNFVLDNKKLIWIIGAEMIKKMKKSDVKALRIKLGLSQAAFAARYGINKQTVWRWENRGMPTKGVAKTFLERLMADIEAENEHYH